MFMIVFTWNTKKALKFCFVETFMRWEDPNYFVIKSLVKFFVSVSFSNSPHRLQPQLAAPHNHLVNSCMIVRVTANTPSSQQR